jgi:hypothetical protein
MSCSTNQSRFVVAILVSILCSEIAFSQTENQPLVTTKLSRLLQMPTVPVSTNAGDVFMVLDTGASGVAVDPLFARVMSAGHVDIPDRAQNVSLSFDIQIGKLRSNVTQVTVLDLDQLREHLAIPVMGVVGMSVLRETCIRCDFDGEQLSLLAKAPVSTAERADIFLAESGRPHVIMSIGRQSFPVMIDLGSQLGLRLPPKVFDAIDSPPSYTILRTMSVNGIRQNLGYKSVSVALGKYTLENVLVERSSDEYGLAGLQFLCRINLLLDFTTKRMHFSPSKRFLARDNDIRFGMSASDYFGEDVENAKIVGFLSKDCPAHIAGIRLGDLLISAKSEYYGERKGEEMYHMLGLPRIGPTTVEVLRERKPLRFVLD